MVLTTRAAITIYVPFRHILLEIPLVLVCPRGMYENGDIN